MVKSVHYNENKKVFVGRTYKDQTMTVNGPATTSVRMILSKWGIPG